jgi:hypothetical protein
MTLCINRQTRAGQYALWLGTCLLLLTTNSTASNADSVPSSQTSPGASEQAADDSQTLPPGHPPIDSMQDAQGEAGEPRDSNSMGSLSRDTVIRSPAIAVGTIEVRVVNIENKPVAGAALIVQVHRESVSEGNSETQREATTGPAGVSRFDHLAVDSALSYRVVLSDAGIKYGVQPFQLTEQAGVSLTLHQYPIVHDIRRALVAMESLVFVEPRDDVFQFEVVHELYNIGKTIWVPDLVDVRLPSDRKAFSVQQSADDVRVESSEVGVHFVGAVPPGPHQVAYTFHVPRHNAANASFDFELPPNVMQVRVALASGRNAELQVDGFPDPQPTTAQNGQRLLLTSKRFERPVSQSSELRFEVRGLPTLGIGRIVAAVVASCLALAGLGFALSKRRRERPDRQASQLEDRARDRLFAELAELEMAKLNGRIGPQTYQETHSVLIEALVRLEPSAQ